MAQTARERTLRTTEDIGAWAHLLSSLEYLVREDDRRPGGVNDWAVSSPGLRIRSRVLRRLAHRVADRRVTRALLVARVVAAGALLTPIPRRYRFAADAFLAGTKVALYPGSRFGGDGSDHAALLVQTAAAIARAGRDRPYVTDACLWFLSAQSVLSYFASGWAKVLGASWRSGAALTNVMRTVTYGDRVTWELLRRFPRSARLLGAGVVTMECTFPLLYAFRGRTAPLYVASAAAFHLANARVMGLNRFLPAFVAMHPAVLYTARPDDRRDDSVLRVYAALGAATVAGLAVAQVSYRRRVRRGHGDERRLRTGTGNELAYRRSGPATGTAPLLILENGLGTTAQAWERIRAGLAERYAVVTYDRAGTGASHYAGRDAGYRLDVAVSDLADLVRAVAPGRAVVLVGYSLGGYLAWRAAERGVAAAVVLIDPSHPEELRRSAAQHAGVAVMDEFVATVRAMTRVGLGGLVRVPEMFSWLPDDARRLAAAQYRDARLWAATAREWAATRHEFETAALAPLPVPALVLTAGRTADADPVQRELHQAMAAATPGGRARVLDRTAHETMLVKPAAADLIRAEITAFVPHAAAGRGIP